MTTLLFFFKSLPWIFISLSIAQTSEKPIEVCGKLETMYVGACMAPPCPTGVQISLLTSKGEIVVLPPKNFELGKKLMSYAKEEKQVCLAGTGSKYVITVTGVALKDQNTAPASQPIKNESQSEESAK